MLRNRRTYGQPRRFGLAGVFQPMFLLLWKVISMLTEYGDGGDEGVKTSQELRMLSSVTINCQV